MNGLLLKLDTGAAVAAQVELRKVTDETFVSLGRQSDAAEALEKRMVGLGKSVEMAFVQQPGGLLLPKHLADVGKATGVAKEGLGSFSKSAGEAASSASQTVGVLGKLAGVAGIGAAGGIGRLAGLMKGLVASINPVGIAVGIAAAAVITFAQNLGAASTPAEKFRASLADAGKEMNFIADSAGRSTSAIASLADAQREFAAAGNDTVFAARANVLKQQEEAVRRLRAEIERQGPKSDDKVLLNIDQVKELAGALNLSADALKKLQAVGASGKSLISGVPDMKEAVYEFAKASGIWLETTNGGTTAALSLAGAVRAIEESMAKGKKEAEAYAEAAQQVKDTETELASQLAATQAVLGDVSAWRQQIEVLKTDESQRNERKAVLEAEAKLLRTGTLLNEEQKAAILALATELGQLTDAEKVRVQLAAEQKQADEERVRAIESQANRIRELKDDEQVYLAVTEKQIAAKKLLAEINDELARQKIDDPNSAEGAALTKQIQATAAAKEYAQTLREVQAVGREVGESVGAAFADAAFAAGKFSDNLKDALKQLAIMESKKLIQQLLGEAGSAIAGLFVAQPPAGGGTATRMHGGGMPNGNGPTAWAMSGMLLDRFQTLTAGNQRVQVAEGGPSTPEVIVPLKRDRYGDLGIGGSGGGSTYVFNVPNVRTADDIRAAKPTMRQMAESIDRAGRSKSPIRGGAF